MRPGLWLAPILLLTTATAAVCLGHISFTPIDVLSALCGMGSPESAMIILHFRLPRVGVAIIAGAGLAVSGTALQSATRNELAEPATIGISAGAGLGVLVLLLFFPVAAAKMPMLLPFAALCGGGYTLGLVMFLTGAGSSATPNRLLLTGIAVGIGLTAAQLLIAMRMSREIYNFAFTWSLGSLAGMEWIHAVALIPWVAVLCIVLQTQARTMDVMALGDESAIGLGLPLKYARWLIIGVAAALASACTAIVGNIGLIGLLAPHLARRFAGRSHARLLPSTAVFGSMLLVVSDMLARRLPTAIEIPAGVLAAGFGIPFFLFFLLRSKT